MAQFRGVVLDTSFIEQVPSIGKSVDLATYRIACSYSSPGIPSIYEYEETAKDCLGDISLALCIINCLMKKSREESRLLLRAPIKGQEELEATYKEAVILRKVGRYLTQLSCADDDALCYLCYAMLC